MTRLLSVLLISLLLPPQAAAEVMNIVSDSNGWCITVPGGTPAIGMNLVLAECGAAPAQAWVLDDSTNRISPQANADLCVNFPPGPSMWIPHLWPCSETSENRNTWEWASGQTIKSLESEVCITVTNAGTHVQFMYLEIVSGDSCRTWSLQPSDGPTRTTTTHPTMASDSDAMVV